MSVMAASNGAGEQQRPENKAVPLKWPLKREEYELLEVIGMLCKGGLV